MAALKQSGRDASRLSILLQSVVGLLVAVGFAGYSGRHAALSSLYGTMVAVVMAVILAWSVRLASASSGRSKMPAVAVLYAGAAIRFVLVLVLLGLGLWLFRLDPLPVLCGFVIVQFVYPLLIRIR
ncbi:MAG: ATP synthase subunit I [Gammaproteobacteria bacterium]|nr:MAG: ATP synthase subunit I [Gammaproteobacteria bacterium]